MFLNLDPEKQKRILNAAIREFAEQGYEQASTNRIVKEAGIGKGMLFYYFNSKKDLYRYVTEYGIQFITDEYLHKINENEPDFIEKYKQIGRLKMKASAENPYIFIFFGNMYLHQDSEELPDDIKARLDEVRTLGFAKIYQNIDTSLFRRDIPQGTVIKLIQWILAGYEKEIVDRLQGQNLSGVDMEPYWDEFYGYLDDLKKLFYQ